MFSLLFYVFLNASATYRAMKTQVGWKWQYSSPVPFSVGRELGRKRLTAYTFVRKFSLPRILEAHRYCVDFSLHSSPIGKLFYRLHLNFRLEAPGERLPISATRGDMKLH
jgi:hypothetical protein